MASEIRRLRHRMASMRGSCLRRVCVGSRPGPRCRVGSGWPRRCAACGSSAFPDLVTGGRVPRSARCRSRTRTGSGRRTWSCRRRRRGPAATIGPMPGRSIRVEPGRGPSPSAREGLDLFSTATSSASCSAASRRRVFPASRGRTEARIALACKAVMSFLALPGQLRQQPLQPVDGLDPLPGQLFASVDQHPQRLELDVVGSTRSPGSGLRPRRPSARPGRRSCGCGRCRTAAPGRRACTSTTCSPSASSR